MIPRHIIQIWIGQLMPERLAEMLAHTRKWCHEHDFAHSLWTLNDDREVICKHSIFDNYVVSLLRDPVSIILKDKDLPDVVSADILRFIVLKNHGGFYADIDLQIIDIPDDYLTINFVCGYERPRIGLGKERETAVCTAFIGAAESSPVLKEMVNLIKFRYDELKRLGKKFEGMFDVLDFAGPDAFTKVLSNYQDIKPFPYETFYPWPIPSVELQYTCHYFVGSKKGGWTNDQCKNIQCKTCPDKISGKCNIVREGEKT